MPRAGALPLRMALATAVAAQCAAFHVSRVPAPALLARRPQRPARPSARAAVARAAAALPAAGDQVPYVFDVFIEDTDCFGVVYNANYLKFFDRARQSALGVQKLAELQRPAGGDGEGAPQYLRLETNKEIKLSGSAVLGQQIEVHRPGVHARAGARLYVQACRRRSRTLTARCKQVLSTFAPSPSGAGEGASHLDWTQTLACKETGETVFPG